MNWIAWIVVGLIAGVLAKFPPEEQRKMADENGVITVDCAFCARKFPLAAAV